MPAKKRKKTTREIAVVILIGVLSIYINIKLMFK